MTIKKLENLLNTAFGVFGTAAVWAITHNWWAVFFTIVAALHITLTED